MALVATAAIAGTSAAAAYIDAKFRMSNDISALVSFKKAEKLYAKAIKENRQSLWYFFADSVARYPSARCIWSRDGEYTWQETHDHACRYAQYFLSLSVKPGQLVAFYLQNSPHFMFAWLGLWAIGCAPAFINYNLSGEALLHCLKVAGASVVLVDVEHGCVERIQEVEDKIKGQLGIDIRWLTEGLKRDMGLDKAELPPDEHRAGVTGELPIGTTGMPKGCSFPTARGWATTGYRSSAYGQKPGPGGDAWYICMPLYHGTGGVSAMVCMMGGVSLCIGRKFSTSGFWSDVRDSNSTFFVYVGETARYLLAAPPHPLDKKHKIRCMYGNGLRPDVWIRFRDRFNVPEVAEFFSSTEGVLGFINWCRGDYLAGCVGHHGALLRFLYRNIYVPVAIDPATNDIIRDPVTGFATRQPYAQGGEIIVQVPTEQAFAGYWHNSSATAKKFIRDVFAQGDLWYRSGDALRRDADGRWFFLDRLGDTYRWKSENVSTAEVAAVLGRFPGVVEANVYGVLIPGHDGRAGCAALFIAPEERARFDYDALLNFAMAKLPRYAVPVFLRIVDSVNPIHNNKQNKVPLREEGVDPAKRGSRVGGAQGDPVLWIPPRGERYVEFRRGDWEGLVGGRVRL
ncbi:hypothetical protein MMC16_003652 [Acarospora aff. strigata]|nr:hypothetical protein [Acarospora aff. strigata]